MGEIWALGTVMLGITFIFLPISGAFFNPAMVAGARILRRINSTDALYFVLAQFAGALFGTILSVFFLSCGAAPRIEAFRPDNFLCGTLGEMMGAFSLGLIAYLGSRENTMGYALAIGAVFSSAVAAFGSISGGYFNPALSLAFAIVGHLDPAAVWQHFLGAFLGAAAAATIDQVLQQIKD